MSSIDSRVVQLTFDNDQFEDAVETTLDSLEDLEEGLDFESSTDSFDSITAAADDVDLSSIESSLSALEDRFSVFGTVCTTIISNLTTTITNSLGSAISSVTSSIFSGGVTRVLNLEQAYFSLEGLLDTEEEVNEIMDNVNTAVDGTAYSLDSAAKVAASLVASGVEGGEEMTTVLQAIAGVAAQTGSEYSDIGEIFTTVAGNGQLMTEQLRQFSYRGLNAAAVLAEALGTTEANIYEMVSDGEIDFQTFSDAMYEAFGEHAKDANKTFSGVCSNISSALSRIGALFVDDILANEGPMVEFLNSLKEVINDIKDYVTELADVWEEWAIGVLEWGTDILTNLDMSGFWDSFYKIFYSLADTVTYIAGGIVDVFGAIGEGFNSVFTEDIGDVLYNLVDGFNEFITSIGLTEEGLDDITSVSKGFFSVIDAGLSVIGVFVDFLGEMATSGIVQNLVTLFLNLAGAVGDFVYEVIEGLGSKGIWNTISSGLTGVLDVFDNILEGLAGIIDSGVEYLIAAVPDVVDWISGTFGELWGNLTDGISGVWGVIKDIFSWLTSNVSGSDILTAITTVLSAEGLGNIVTDVKSIVKMIKNIVETINDVSDDGIFTALLGSDYETVLENLGDCLKELTTMVSAVKLTAIAVAVLALAEAMGTISEIDSSKILTSLGSVIALLVSLVGLYTTLTAVGKKFNKGSGGSTTGFLALAVSMVAIAEAVSILSDAMTGLGEMSIEECATAIVSFIVIINRMKSLMKATIKLNSTGSISDISTAVAIATEMLGLVIAIKLLAGTFQDLGSMDLTSVVTAVIAMTALTGELSLLIKAMTKLTKQVLLSKDLVANAFALIEVAAAMVLMAKALQELSEMSLEETATSVAAMAVVLTEMLVSIKILSKISDASTAKTNALTMIVLAGTLMALAQALKMFATMSWEEIGTGLVAMGGALGELVAVIAILAQVTKVKNAQKNVATLTTLSAALVVLAIAMNGFAAMSWEEIARGLVAMGGALGEVTAVVAILSKCTSSVISALGGALAVVVLAGLLSEIASALQSFGSMSWTEVGVGLVAMGFALAEMTVVIGVLSALGIGSVSALIGAAAVVELSESLGNIADALTALGGLTWEGIGKGLTAMGLALAELTAGSFLNSLNVIGSYSLNESVQALGELYEAIASFASLGDAGVTGAQNLYDALEVIAAGTFANTLSGLGSSVVTEVAEPLGTLAESVAKWADVSVPENLFEDLQTLASGVSQFTLSGFGAETVATVAEPLGTLADSVQKWSGITIPEDLGSNLSLLGDAIGEFGVGDIFNALVTSSVGDALGSFGESMAVWSDLSIPTNINTQLRAVAHGIEEFGSLEDLLGVISLDLLGDQLGTLATSLESWSGVTVPDGIDTQLEALATGVKAFGADDIGDLFSGSILSSAASTLPTLATAVTSWADVTVPEGIGTGLTDLATGVKAFGVDNLGDLFTGTMIESAITYLPQLATAVTAWATVSVPEDIGTTLESLATGLKAFGAEEFSDLFNSSGINMAIDKLPSLADAISSFSDVGVSSNLGDMLSSLAEGVKAFAAEEIADIKVKKVSSLAGAIDELVAPMTSASVIDYSSIATGITDICTALSLSESVSSDTLATSISTLATSLTNSSGSFTSAGTELGTIFIAGLVTGVSTSTSEAVAIVTACAKSMKNKSSEFTSAGKTCIKAFANGLKTGKSTAVSAAQSAATSAANGARSKYSAFYNAGYYLIKGLANGIKSGKSLAISAATSVATAALTAAEKALDENSPSKATEQMGLYFDEGLSIGIAGKEDEVANMATSIGLGTLSSLSSALSGAANIVTDSMGMSADDISTYAKSMTRSISSSSPTSSTSALQQMLMEDNMKMFESNNRLANELNELRNDMNTYTSAISGMETTMYVDGKKLASSIAKPMNQSLATLTKRGRLSS